MDRSLFQVRRNHPRDSLSMLLSNQISQMPLQKVQSVKLGLSEPCCLVCNYVLCRICKDDRLSSVSYSGHHLPEAVLSETRHWIETLLRDYLTSSKFQKQLAIHLKSLHLANGSNASQETNASISPELEVASLVMFPEDFFSVLSSARIWWWWHVYGVAPRVHKICLLGNILAAWEANA